MSDDLSKALARDPGFYRVRWPGREWTVAEWAVDTWWYPGKISGGRPDDPTEIGRRVLFDSESDEDDRAELMAALREAPILSQYHGQRGFEVERFIDDYDQWRAKARTALARVSP